MHLRKKLAPGLALLLGCCAGCQPAQQLWSKLVPAKPDLSYLAPVWRQLQLQGQFVAEPSATEDNHEPGLLFAWSHSGACLRFTGPPPAFLVAKADDGGSTQYYTLAVDDHPPVTVALLPGQQRLQLPATAWAAKNDEGSAVPHQLHLRRQSEASAGVARLSGAAVLSANTELLPPLPQRRRRILLIGDSITTGYGNLGAGPSCHFDPKQQAASLTFGPLAAQTLGAEADLVAWSGRGAALNGDGSTEGTMTAVWQKVLPEAAAGVDGAKDNPLAPQYSAVVINLGTNDIRHQPFDARGFAAAHKRLWAAVRRRHRLAHIVVAVGPMLTDDAAPKVSQLKEVRQALAAAISEVQAAGELQLSLLEFPRDDGSLGLGCDYHPNVARHRAMAAQLAKHLSYWL